jgi:hypothetical protein
MKTFRIIFRDAEGNDLYSKDDDFFSVDDAVEYADKIIANGRSSEDHFYIYQTS